MMWVAVGAFLAGGCAACMAVLPRIARAQRTLIDDIDRDLRRQIADLRVGIADIKMELEDRKAAERSKA